MCPHSKPLQYGIALNELNSDIVHQYVGQEPSGGKFNALELDYNSESTSQSRTLSAGRYLENLVERREAA